MATVLFADLVGSTALAGQQDAERTRARLNRFYEAMAGEIGEAGGTIEKFIGDAVVAAFGAPAAQEDHADRALHAALVHAKHAGQDLRRLTPAADRREHGRRGRRRGARRQLVRDRRLGQRRRAARTGGGTRPDPGGGTNRSSRPRRVRVRRPGSDRGEGKARRRSRPSPASRARPRGDEGGRRSGDVRRARGRARGARVGVRERVVADGAPRFQTVVGEAGIGKTTLLRELWQRFDPSRYAVRGAAGRSGGGVRTRRWERSCWSIPRHSSVGRSSA